MRRFLRSPGEYAFRLHQETQNVRLWAFPPKWRRNVTIPSPLPFLPSPAAIAGRLRGTKFASEVIAAADALLQHRFPILGITVDTGPEIHWRRDHLSGIETGLQYFRRIPYLNARLAGDHKRIWELNRHQHLLLLAQAWLLTEHRPYLKETQAQLESWMRANPMQRGINWTSALEVALRGLSWLWLYHLIPGHLPAEFVDCLYQHGRHLAVNLSVYFSPNTHLLGEAVALHALGLMFGVPSWERTGAEVTEEQIQHQVRDDGSHFEQSTYYHVYALDMFLFHAILRSDTPHWHRDRLAKMAEYLHAITGPDRDLPFIGDDDGGRFFHPFGRHAEFARATLATCRALQLWDGEVEREDVYPQAAWWIGEKALDMPPAGRTTAPGSRLFPDAGMAVMQDGANRIIVDAGPFGPGPAGHSHSDTLSMVVSAGAAQILIDPGTYCYVDDPKWRNWFRGSSAHNTVRIDGKDQAVPVNPFRWANTPVVRLLEWMTGEKEDTLEAECSYAGFEHRRKIRLIKPGLLLIKDEISGPGGEHTLEQFWHPGETVHRLAAASFHIGDGNLLVLDSEADLQEGGEHGWRAPAFGQRIPAPVVRVERRCALPARFLAAIYLDAPPQTEILFNPRTAKFSVSRLGDFQLD
jgi:Heparinase II/III-like protein/Heparinase II/III N-terminus